MRAQRALRQPARSPEGRPNVTGYPGHLLRVCDAVDPAKLRALGLRFICTGGEVLTAAMRARITEAFGVPLYDSYGSYECDLIASECPNGGDYHVCDDSLALAGSVIAAGGETCTFEIGVTDAGCSGRVSSAALTHLDVAGSLRSRRRRRTGAESKRLENLAGRVGRVDDSENAHRAAACRATKHIQCEHPAHQF